MDLTPERMNASNWTASIRGLERLPLPSAIQPQPPLPLIYVVALPTAAGLTLLLLSGTCIPLKSHTDANQDR